MKINKKFNEKIENLIKLSYKKNKKFSSEYRIPWELAQDQNYTYMPEKILSLGETKLFENLTKDEKQKLAHSEIIQVMYSYAWSEGLACHFFFRAIQEITDMKSPIYRYLLIEAEEESRHQQMFARVIRELDGNPIGPTKIHRILGKFATKFLPNDIMFLSVLGIELVTDAYGELLQADESVHPILRKVSLLHNMEEARHIHFTELLLEETLKKASSIKKSVYTIVVCLNIYFMRTLYVRRSIFTNMGLNHKKYYRPAKKGIKKKFNKYCLKKAEVFVNSFNGFNWFTKIIWKLFLG